jgi:uncharacterized MAPEG superfamily protein
MPEFAFRPAFVAYALSCVVLSLNLFVLAGMTGAGRGKAKTFQNPEDAGKAGKVDPIDPAWVARVKRAHYNALENFVPFAVLGLLYVLFGATARGAYILFGTYVVARILHSIVYLSGKQPWRTILYAIGALATLGMMIQITRAAIALLM